jgi:hypothetical protein
MEVGQGPNVGCSAKGKKMVQAETKKAKQLKHKLSLI